MNKNEIQTLSNEYGVELLNPRAVRALTRDNKITSPGHYVGACRRLAARHGVEIEPDGRLIAVGFNYFSPRKWVLEGILGKFLIYWGQLVSRPNIVGSCKNEVTPDEGVRLWRAKIQAKWVKTQVWRRNMPPVNTKRRHRQMHDAARAALRSSAKGRVLTDGPDVWWKPTTGLFITRGALSQCGRLSPELQTALLTVSGAYAPLADNARRIIGCRDLRWDLLAPIARDMAADKTGRLRAAWAFSPLPRGGQRFWSLVHTGAMSAEWEQHLKFTYHDSQGRATCTECEQYTVSWLCPSYPGVPLDTAVRLCKGETPVQISRNLLSKSEAHEWLTDYAQRTPECYLRALLLRAIGDMGSNIRDPAVIRWALEVHRRGSWGQLTRMREFNGPAGMRISARYIDRIDEVMDIDLQKGIHSRVEDVFRSVVQRTGEIMLQKDRENHRVLCGNPGWRLYPKAMRLLRTPAELVREGDEMRHCVGGYSTAVEAGKCYILALSVGIHRSTVEISPRGEILQHRGPHNREPEPVLVKLLSRFLYRNKL